MSHRNPITLALANAKDLIKSTAAALMSGAVIPKSDLMQNLTLLVEIADYRAVGGQQTN
ncbi:MAG: hypothetical protein IPG70_09555 [Moraxellaceae bacterium]|nr:hypothetical protein [Moraxellaceae bacterium]